MSRAGFGLRAGFWLAAGFWLRARCVGRGVSWDRTRFPRAAALATCAAVFAAAACTHDDVARPLELRSQPVPFSRDRKIRDTRGKLVWRGGLELTSPDRDFGGLSAILVAADGSRFIAVSDEAHWVTGALTYDAGGRLAGASGETIAPLLGLDGHPLEGKQGDAEGLASEHGNDTTGDLFVSFEGDHRVWRYAFGKDGVMAVPSNVPVPRDLFHAPRNGGLEGITGFGEGLMFGVTERYRDAAGEYRAWFVSTTVPTTPSTGNGVALTAAGDRSGDAVGDSAGNPAGAPAGTPAGTPAGAPAGARAVSLHALAPYAMTDVRRLPDGDVLTLERRYSAAKGVGSQLRRIPRAAMEAAAAAGASSPLDGEVVASFDAAYEIDNMEGLAVRAGPAGETLVYAVSDDNFNRPVQRTLLLMYELLP